MIYTNLITINNPSKSPQKHTDFHHPTFTPDKIPVAYKNAKSYTFYAQIYKKS